MIKEGLGEKQVVIKVETPEGKLLAKFDTLKDHSGEPFARLMEDVEEAIWDALFRLEKGDNVVLPNGNRGSIQGWAIEQSIKDFPKRKPYKRTSRKQALASDAPMVEVWNMSKPSSEPTEFYPLAYVNLAK